MAAKFISLQAVIAILGAVMIVSLALTIVTFPFALIWIGQPFGNVATTMADAFATVFSVAFFTAFVLAMAEQQPGSSGPH
jgi:predicted membrane protein